MYILVYSYILFYVKGKQFKLNLLNLTSYFCVRQIDCITFLFFTSKLNLSWRNIEGMLLCLQGDRCEKLTCAFFLPIYYFCYVCLSLIDDSFLFYTGIFSVGPV